MGKSPISVCFYIADQNAHRDRSRGITVYTLGLMSHLRSKPELKLSGLGSKSSVDIPEGIERVMLPFRSDHLLGRLATDHLHPFFVKGHRPDIWHYPKGFLPFGIQVSGKRVGTVADVMLQYDADRHPDSRPRLAWSYWIGLLKHSIRNLDLIITISEFSKRAILEFCERHGIGCPPIVVIFLGVTVTPTIPAPLKEDYVLHLASKYPYKATRWLVSQWSSLNEKDRGLPRLKLVGELDDEAAEIFSRTKNVDLIPPMPRAELEIAIAKAKALLLPSEIEGFGIPAVEGYLLGTPVAYAQGTALEEIIGIGSTGGFHRDRDSLYSALREILDMERSQVEQKADTMREKYTWTRCVKQTLDAYRIALGL